jgi:prephenate dehydrogenase
VGAALNSVVVVGTGLIGTSIALALRRQEIEVFLQDRDPRIARTAAGLGAGTAGEPPDPVDLTVLAVPPTAVGPVLEQVQRRRLSRAYTDVASTKHAPHRDIVAAGCDLRSYVGGHPMAGRERSGPLAARADLFQGRPWVLTPGPRSDPAVQDTVEQLVELCGGIPVVMDCQEHDSTVALVSHAPHLMASLMAARLTALPQTGRFLAGRGLSDVIRTAGGSPQLWTDILSSNAGPVVDILDQVALDLRAVATALRTLHASRGGLDERALADLMELLGRGNAGYEHWQTNEA